MIFSLDSSGICGTGRVHQDDLRFENPLYNYISSLTTVKDLQE